MGVYAKRDYQIIGEPRAFSDAENLARTNPYQFQWWALSLIRARPANPSKVDPKIGKTGADKGIDGWLTFKEGEKKELEKIVVQVKGGASVGAKDVRDLSGTIGATKSAMGILISLFEPTQPMKEAAYDAGYYESPTWGQNFPRVQIVTIQELLDGKEPKLPKTFAMM